MENTELQWENHSGEPAIWQMHFIFINAGGVAAAVSAKSENIQCRSVY